MPTLAPKLFHAPKKKQKLRTVIFVHGYYGSALKHVGSTKLQFFHPLRAMMGKTRLTLHTEELELPHAPELEAHGVLGSIEVIPKLFSVDVYGNFLQRLQNEKDLQMIPFAYDWRRDLIANVQEFGKLIDSLEHTPEIMVVAHSMGGLLLSYYLAFGTSDLAEAKQNWTGAKKISKAVILGAPFRGAAKCLWDFGNGSKLPLYERFLKPDWIASFPGIYYLLPTPKANLLDSEEKNRKVDLFQLTNWQRLNFPFHHDSLEPALQKKRLAFSQRHLERSARFHELLLSEAQTKTPKSCSILNIVGTGRRTLDALALTSKPTAKRSFSYRKTLRNRAGFVDGDDTVTAASAELPELFTGERWTTGIRHDQMLCEKEVQDKVCEFLTIGRENHA